MSKIKITLLVIPAVILQLLCFSYFYVSRYISVVNFIHPGIQLDVPMDQEAITSKQLYRITNETIGRQFRWKKYNLTIGEIDMNLDRKHRGEITLTYVEKGHKNPCVFYARMNTKENMFYSIMNQGRDSKIDPGEIDFEHWKIDSTDAVKITEEFYKNEPGFDYDEIWLRGVTAGMVGEEEVWFVYLSDKEKNIRYETRINGFTGEIITNHITRWDEERYGYEIEEEK